MLKHIKTKHTSESEKKYQCGECGKGFIEKNRLSVHTQSVHTNEKPFPCRFMYGFACSDLGNRTKHEKLKHGGQEGEVKAELLIWFWINVNWNSVPFLTLP